MRTAAHAVAAHAVAVNAVAVHAVGALVVSALAAGTLVVGALAACTLTGCKPGAVVDTPDAVSPQASAVPAPLGNVPALTSALPLGPDAGRPPTPVRGDRALSPDTATKDKEIGYTLQGVFRPGDPPPVTRGAEVSAQGIEAARKKTEARLEIELSASRARMAVTSRGFVLPPEAELRARSDRYGYIVLWPGGTSYRTLAAGSLRSLLGERRFDVAPPSAVDLTMEGDGARRLGLKTRRVAITTRAATAKVELAHVPDLGEGGVLLCRALLDLLSAPPTTALCGWDELPMHAELKWTSQGTILFDVGELARRTDMPSAALLVPPATAAYAAWPPSSPQAEVILTTAELAALRTAAIDVPLAATPPGQEPPTGLLLQNTTDVLRFAWLDGVPVAWLAPGARIELKGIQRGRYQLQWRTFLGDSLEPPQVATVPGVSVAGATDGGASPQ